MPRRLPAMVAAVAAGDVATLAITSRICRVRRSNSAPTSGTRHLHRQYWMIRARGMSRLRLIAPMTLPCSQVGASFTLAPCNGVHHAPTSRSTTLCW